MSLDATSLILGLITGMILGLIISSVVMIITNRRQKSLLESLITTTKETLLKESQLFQERSLNSLNTKALENNQNITKAILKYTKP